MDDEHTNLDVETKAAQEAFPASVDPPWKARRPLLLTIALPLALVAASGATVAIHLSIRGGGEDGGGPRLVIHKRPNDASALFDRYESTGDWERRAPSVVVDTDAGSGVSDPDAHADEASGDAEPSQADEPSPDQEDATKAAGGGELAVYTGQVGKGNTISQRLGQHGLTGRDVNEIVEAFEGHFDFRRCRPRHSYTLEVDKTSGAVQRFLYEASPTEKFEARRKGSKLIGRQVEIEVRSRWVREGGKVGSSLSEALSKAGFKRQVLRAFLQTFGRDINFQDDLRPTDTFRVIAEEELLKGEFVQYNAVWAIEYIGKSVGKLQAFYFAPSEGRGKYYDSTGRTFERNKLRTPLNYTRISSRFDLNRFHPVLKRRRPHRGVDFAAPRGTPVWATADGVVTFRARKGPNGNLVILRHDGSLESMYAHLQKFARGLTRGQEVNQGQVIGYVGSTGRSTGPHLHFGLRLNGQFVDPLKIKAGPGRPIKGEYRAGFFKQMRKLQRELSRIRVR